MNPLTRKRLKVRLLSWAAVVLLGFLVVAILVLLGYRPGDGSSVAAALGNPWLALACFVVACELDYWSGYGHGMDDLGETARGMTDDEPEAERSP